jgi:GDP-4-dehydro-6-deoxy-D-mannose reductase
VFPDAVYPNRQQMDVRNAESVRKFIEETRPDAVIHLAAMAGIPLCENDKANAWATNVEGTRNVVSASRDSESVKRFVYLQTACIFP